MKYYVGIDLGGTFIKGGIVSEDGRILFKDKIPTAVEKSFEGIASDIAEFAASLSKRAEVEIEAVGIGSPGTVDSKHGIVVYSNNINWKNANLGKAVSDKLNLPVSITNDANAAALGECFMGAGKNYKTVVLVTLGTGVGGGIVIDGKLFEGGYSAGAEIGHTLVKMNGERCTCGRRGCLEAYASATALIRQTKRAMTRYPESKMWQLCGGDLNAVEGKTAFDGLSCGDVIAKRVVNKYIDYLAAGLTDICNVFRPDAVLLGGGICAAGDVLLKPLKKKVEKAVFGGVEYAPIKILNASLGNDAGICGAARLAMENFR